MQRNKFVIGLMSTAAFAAGVISWGRFGVEPWEVRDSKGRVRVDSLEEGDSFGICLRDVTGTRRLVLQSAGSGAPTIRMFSATGKEIALIQEAPSGDVGVVLHAPDGLPLQLGSEAKGGAVVALGTRGKEGPAVMLTADAKGQTAVVSVAQTDGGVLGEAVLFEGRSGRAGLRFERDRDPVTGLSVDAAKAILWMGANAMKSATDALGVRLGWDGDVGGFLTLRHTPVSGHVLLQDYEKRGAGLQVGRTGEAGVRVGRSVEGSARVVILGKTGEPVAELPHKDR